MEIPRDPPNLTTGEHHQPTSITLKAELQAWTCGTFKDNYTTNSYYEKMWTIQLVNKLNFVIGQLKQISSYTNLKPRFKYNNLII